MEITSSFKGHLNFDFEFFYIYSCHGVTLLLSERHAIRLYTRQTAVNHRCFSVSNFLKPTYMITHLFIPQLP